MINIQTLDNISPLGLAQFPKKNYKISTDNTNPDAILLRSTKMHDRPIADNLKAVGRAGAGVNNIPLEQMSAKGVVVFNAPGANANAVKELVIGSILLASRNICQAWQYVNELPLHHLKTAIEAGKKNYAGTELPNKTLGIVGLGAIGVQIANAAQALGMTVVGFDPSITIKSAWKLSSQVNQAPSMDALFSQSDFVSFHVPLLDSTKNLLNAKRIALLPKGAVILNFARDGIVDEIALKQALDNGKVKYYVTDFPIDNMKNHQQVIALPHLGASTFEAEDNCAMMVVKQIKDYLEHGNITNAVNFPETIMPRAADSRLAIAHQNIPNMVGQISTVLANAQINIIDMLNKSKADIAYTLIDMEGKISANTVDNIQQIEGVLRVRDI